MTDDSNILDVLVTQIDDEQLRSRVAREIELLRGSRRFGLVFGEIPRDEYALRCPSTRRTSTPTGQPR